MGKGIRGNSHAVWFHTAPPTRHGQNHLQSAINWNKSNNLCTVPIHSSYSHGNARLLFWCLLSLLICKSGMNTKMTPLWKHKQFTTSVHTLVYLFCFQFEEILYYIHKTDIFVIIINVTTSPRIPLPQWNIQYLSIALMCRCLLIPLSWRHFSLPMLMDLTETWSNVIGVK